MSAYRTVTDPDEREALKRLLRGATETLALLPAGSNYLRSAAVLEQGLVDILGEDGEA